MNQWTRGGYRTVLADHLHLRVLSEEASPDERCKWMSRSPSPSGRSARQRCLGSVSTMTPPLGIPLTCILSDRVVVAVQLMPTALDIGHPPYEESILDCPSGLSMVASCFQKPARPRDPDPICGVRLEHYALCFGVYGLRPGGGSRTDAIQPGQIIDKRLPGAPGILHPRNSLTDTPVGLSVVDCRPLRIST